MRIGPVSGDLAVRNYLSQKRLWRPHRCSPCSKSRACEQETAVQPATLPAVGGKNRELKGPHGECVPDLALPLGVTSGLRAGRRTCFLPGSKPWCPGWVCVWDFVVGGAGGTGRRRCPWAGRAGLTLQEQFMLWDLGSGQGTVPASCRGAGRGGGGAAVGSLGLTQCVPRSPGPVAVGSAHLSLAHWRLLSVPDGLLQHRPELKRDRVSVRFLIVQMGKLRQGHCFSRNAGLSAHRTQVM